MSVDKVKEKIHKPRVYGYKFNLNIILYNCTCGDLEHGVKYCPNGHKLDWRGKHKTWKSKKE